MHTENSLVALFHIPVFTLTVILIADAHLQDKLHCLHCHWRMPYHTVYKHYFIDIIDVAGALIENCRNLQLSKCYKLLSWWTCLKTGLRMGTQIYKLKGCNNSLNSGCETIHNTDFTMQFSNKMRFKTNYEVILLFPRQNAAHFFVKLKCQKNKTQLKF